MRKELIIHVGSAKTGSTSLAMFCKENSAYLRKIGICYPEAGRYASNDHFYLFSSVLPDEWYAAKKVGTFEEEWVPVVHELEDAFAHGARFGLLSFSGFLQFNREQLDRVRLLFKDFEVRIVYYVRRQDKLLMSMISQGMKAGDPKVWSVETGVEAYTHLLDFQSCLKPFEEVFGQERIQILPFEKPQMIGGDVIQDFFSKVFNVSIEGSQARQLLKENVGLTRDALEFKMLLNRLGESAVNSTRYQSLLEAYSAKAREKGDDPLGDVSLLCPMERLRIIKQYESCNRSVAVRYLGRPDGRLFFDPLPDLDEPWEDYPGLGASKCVEITDFLIREILEEKRAEEKIQFVKQSTSSRASRLVRLRTMVGALRRKLASRISSYIPWQSNR